MNNEVRPNLSNQIIGTYEGTLMSSLLQTGVAATAEITSINDYNIRVHCYSAKFDTTLSLGLYPDGNRMRVCLTGNDFMNQYGHNMSTGNQMMGNNNQMMGNMGNGTSWQQHMSAEHKPGDVHYGYFDMKAKTFDYTFTFTGTSTSYTQHFIGMR
jgi:hypothetical protein